MADDRDLVAQLEGRATSLESELVEKQERLRQLQSELRSSQAALEALKQVIAFERVSRGETPDAAPGAVSPLLELGEMPTQSRSIADAAKIVLAAEGPLHYREITKRLIHQGVPIGGSDPNATVVGALVRDSRFYRPRRGTYYLRELARGPVTNVGARHRKRA